MKAEDDCSVERKHTLKLRHAMEQRPSQELLWELQQEKALLQARVQGLEASVQVGPAGRAQRSGRGASSPADPPPSPLAPQEGRPDQSSPYIQVLEEDWRQAQRDLQEQTRTVFSLRKDLRQAEAQRARVRGPRWGRWAGLSAPRPSRPLPAGEARLAGRPRPERVLPRLGPGSGPRAGAGGAAGGGVSCRLVPRSAWRRRRCSSCSAWPFGRTPRCTRTASRPSCGRWRRSPSSGTR